MNLRGLLDLYVQMSEQRILGFGIARPENAKP